MAEEDRRNRIEEAAEVVATWPGAWAQLLGVHVAGPDGRCTGCRVGNRCAPHWPCGPAAVALRARRLASATGP
jgi:hypothetical protein